MYLLLSLLVLVVFPERVDAQSETTYEALGTGKGKSRDLAVEEAKINALQAIVYHEARKDTLFRDLFIPEALQYGEFQILELSQHNSESWVGKVQATVDRSLVEALYVGRYATTVVNLLDAAETAILDIEKFLNDAARLESNGIVASAESAYEQARSKIREVLRYLGQIQDAYYFSSIKKRKAPELQKVLQSYDVTAHEGISRLRKAQQELDKAARTQRLLEIFSEIENALIPLEESLSQWIPITVSPHSYSQEVLQEMQVHLKQKKEYLTIQKKTFIQASHGVSGEDPYLYARKTLLQNRLSLVEEELNRTEQRIQQELYWRSPVVQSTVWLVNHVPSEVFFVGFYTPWGVVPANGYPRPVPLSWQAYLTAQGAVSLGEGGLWGKTSLYGGTEYTGGRDPIISQQVLLGFYGRSLWGAGIRWDWWRSETSRTASPVWAVAISGGVPGSSYGKKVQSPLWLNTFLYEIPAGTFQWVRYLNLSYESELNPSSYFQSRWWFASKSRDREDGVPLWIGSAGLELAFRMPILKPFRWKIRWQGVMMAPLEDMVIDFGLLETTGAFDFGFEYSL
ncbi:MAG: hypothetical protein N2Z76_03070 [Treponemataceae bacterium]|nr:hypothetical protein [Treponemataceae bacterium]